MFLGAMVFNQPLSTWNVSSVTYMHYMFANTQAFNQPLDRWHLSAATDISHMVLKR
jgi:surface protein